MILYFLVYSFHDAGGEGIESSRVESWLRGGRPSRRCRCGSSSLWRIVVLTQSDPPLLSFSSILALLYSSTVLYSPSRILYPSSPFPFMGRERERETECLNNV